MGYKKFPYIDIHGVKLSQAGPVNLFNPIGLFASVGHLLHPSIPVGLWRCLSSFLVGSSSYGVVGLTLSLVSVKLTGMWVLTTFLHDVLGLLNLWLKYLYQLPPTSYLTKLVNET